MNRYPVLIASAALVFASALVAQPTTAQTPAAASASRPIPRAQFILDMDAEFKKMDSNADSIVTRLEIDASQRRTLTALAIQRNRQLFAQLDKDRSGQLSAAEFAALAAEPPATNAGPLLAGWDLDRDGRVGLIEFRSATQANFDRMDIDRDGIVSVAEMQRAGIIK